MVEETSSAVRLDMVESAVRFMSTPKVRQTQIEDQKKFLQNKGLTNDEIDTAIGRVRAQYGDNIAQPSNIVPAPPIPQRPSWTDYANLTVLVGGASYGLYVICRKWLLPNLFNVPDPEQEQIRRTEEQVNELQNSIKFVMDGVQQTLNAVQQQQENLNRAMVLMTDKDRSGFSSEQGRQLQELKTEIAVVKSLLLGRHQFAPLPVNQVPSVPSWQLQMNNSDNQSTEPPRQVSSAALSYNGYATPPSIANGFVNGTSDLDESLSENGNSELKTETTERSTPV